MRDTLVTINSFIHDVATGVWVSIIFIVYVISGQLKEISSNRDVMGFASSLLEWLWWLSLTAIAVILLTGILRAAFFKYYGFTGDIATSRKRLLWIKHILLSVVFLLGVYFQIDVTSTIIM